MFVTSRSLLECLNDRGDAAAWRRFQAIYEPWLRGWLARRADLQPADAEDVLQDVLVVVSQELPRFVHNGRPGAFRSWLKAILVNRMRHFLRARQNRDGRVAAQPMSDWVEWLADPASAVSKQWDEEHDRQVIRRTLAAIQAEFNQNVWRMFSLLVLEDRPAAEVAATLGVTANAVYVAKSRVLARLRQELRGMTDF
jgi:RNA polymerase sigma-70 factor (ECF subfamily)